jgi:ABC-type methionine transport system ATPase subunit
MATRRVYLTYNEGSVTKPLIYLMGQKFDVITNVRIASIKGDMGLVALQIDGEEAELEAALAWITSEGVTVEPIAKGDAV